MFDLTGPMSTQQSTNLEISDLVSSREAPEIADAYSMANDLNSPVTQLA